MAGWGDHPAGVPWVLIPDAYDVERDRLLDEPDLDAEQDRREFERLRWGLAQTEAADE